MPTHSEVISTQKRYLITNWEHLLMVEILKAEEGRCVFIIISFLGGCSSWDSSDKNNPLQQLLLHFLGSDNSETACLLKAFFTGQLVCIKWFPLRTRSSLKAFVSKKEISRVWPHWQKDVPGTESGECLSCHTLTSIVDSCSILFEWTIAQLRGCEPWLNYYNNKKEIKQVPCQEQYFCVSVFLTIKTSLVISHDRKMLQVASRREFFQQILNLILDQSRRKCFK